MTPRYTPVQGPADLINTPGYVSAYKIDPATGLPVGGVPNIQGNENKTDAKTPRYPDATPQDPMAKFTSDYFDNLKKTPLTAQEEQAIRDKTAANMQAEIDSINSIYDDMSRQELNAGDARLGSARATAARGGTLGSDFGNAALDNTNQKNLEVQKQIQKEKALRVSAVFGKIDQQAEAAIKAKKEEAQGNAEAYIKYLGENKDQAQQHVKDLASGGLASLDELSKEQYQHILDTTGYDPLTLESIFNANKTKAEKIDYKTEKLDNGKILLYGVDPKTGELVQKTYDAGLGTNESLKIIDDVPYAISTDANGKLTARPISGYKPSPKKTTETKAAQLETAKKDMASQLNTVTGSDGFISPESYKKGKRAWVSAGFASDDYDKQFSSYRNPYQPAENYGLSK